jgi:hypothetical protein
MFCPTEPLGGSHNLWLCNPSSMFKVITHVQVSKQRHRASWQIMNHTSATFSHFWLVDSTCRCSLLSKKGKERMMGEKKIQEAYCYPLVSFMGKNKLQPREHLRWLTLALESVPMFCLAPRPKNATEEEVCSIWGEAKKGSLFSWFTLRHAPHVYRRSYI